jgi:hypothetical protein
MWCAPAPSPGRGPGQIVEENGMKDRWRMVAVALFLAGVGMSAWATPVIDSAVLNLRLWNDDSDSLLTTGNLYPSSIWIQELQLDGDGQGGEYANRHNFRLSDNGGISAANFMNGDGFSFFSDVTVSGTGNGEGGLNLSPWFSQNFDGVFMLRTTDGEISCWGGRLPFYNFTASQGLHYVKGETVRAGFIYDPHGLSEQDPGTIEYWLLQGGTWYTSGVLPFDQGNPNEPQYGFWGILDYAQVGGWFQPYIVAGDPTNGLRIDFDNMVFTPEPASLALLCVAGLLVLRRR